MITRARFLQRMALAALGSWLLGHDLLTRKLAGEIAGQSAAAVIFEMPNVGTGWEVYIITGVIQEQRLTLVKAVNFDRPVLLGNGDTLEVTCHFDGVSDPTDFRLVSGDGNALDLPPSGWRTVEWRPEISEC